MRSIGVLFGMIVVWLSLSSLCVAADTCSPALRRLLEEEGFNAGKIELLCAKFQLYEKHMGKASAKPVRARRAKRRLAAVKKDGLKAPVTLAAELDSLYRNGKYQEVKLKVRQANESGEKDLAFQRVLGKCLTAEASDMKTAGSKQWKPNVVNAYAIAKRLLHSNPSDSDALFIVGHCKILRGRPTSGMKYIRKGLKTASAPKPEYFEVLGDGRMGDPTAGSWATSEMDMRVEAKEFYKKALDAAVTDFERKRIQEKMAPL